ncbi:MAG: hypothetical protein ACEQSC_01315 [Candidatus Nanopelagicaceae bacterium]
MNTQTKYALAFAGNVASLIVLFTCTYTIAWSLTATNDRQLDKEQFQRCQNDPKTTICI